MRPPSIIGFEWLYLFTLLIGAIHAVATWETNVALSSPAFVLTVQTLTFSVLFALVLWVSRGRSNVAKWINVGLFLLGLPGIVILYGRELLLGWHVLTLVQTLLQAVALGLLFTPSARAWLGRKASSPDDLKKTFD